MRSWSRSLLNQSSKILNIPQDVTMELPRITMIGSVHLYVENHRGVLQFSDSELLLLLTKGQLQVHGSKFVIRTILPEEVLLEGHIHEVKYIDS